jgi:iron complex transport system substrate-binding protein
LSAIAPVLHAAADELTWQEITTRLGETIDLAATATRVVDDAESAVARVTNAHPEFEGKTAAHVIVYGEEWGAEYASFPGSDTARLFEKLGFALPDAAERFVDDGAISDELVGLIDADFLLLSTFEEGTADYFTDSALVKKIPAVAEGRVVVNPGDQDTGINYFAWGLNVQSAVSVPWLVEQLADFATQALN